MKLPSVAIIGTRGYPSYYGGFETAVRKLAPYLVDHGWEVTVYGRKDAVQLDDPERDSRVQVKMTSGLDTKSLSTLSYGFFSTIHAVIDKPDVALVMNVANGFWLPTLKLRGIPTLVNVDGIEWDRGKWGRAAKAVFRFGARATARYGTQLVYDAKAIANRWEHDFRRDGVFIPYGGDIPEVLPIETGLTHRTYVLVVARFVLENTIAEFFAATRELAKSVDVVIVGSSGYGGDFDEAARELSESSPRIRWLGHVSDDRRLLSLWQHAGAYFHGHSVGGTNPALVQAMACGAPIVARDTVYNREVLGDAGLLVEPTASSIIDTILGLISDSSLQEKLSKAAVNRAAKEYSWEKVCRDYEKALRALVRTGRR